MISQARAPDRALAGYEPAIRQIDAARQGRNIRAKTSGIVCELAARRLEAGFHAQTSQLGRRSLQPPRPQSLRNPKGMIVSRPRRPLDPSTQHENLTCLRVVSSVKNSWHGGGPTSGSGGCRRESSLRRRQGTRPGAGVSIRCRPGDLSGRQNTDNNPMHRRPTRLDRIGAECRKPMNRLSS